METERCLLFEIIFVLKNTERRIMTKDKIKEVAEYYKRCLNCEAKRYALNEKVGPSFNEGVAIIKHCRYMIDEILSFLRQDRIEKAFRWLGFLQGCLWTTGMFSLDELKEHNRPS